MGCLSIVFCVLVAVGLLLGLSLHKLVSLVEEIEKLKAAERAKKSRALAEEIGKWLN